MENDKIEQIILINKDHTRSVWKSMNNSYLKLKQPDCSFYSEEGYEIPIHKELLLQTKLMQEFVKSIDCCCCKIEVFVPSLTKEELELLVKFLYCGEVICSNKSIACKVFSNLVQFFGFSECMEINGKPIKVLPKEKFNASQEKCHLVSKKENAGDFSSNKDFHDQKSQDENCLKIGEIESKLNKVTKREEYDKVLENSSIISSKYLSTSNLDIKVAENEE